MDQAPLALDDHALLATCRVETFRSHGPGGQHANRTDSAVRLTHLVSGVVVQCQDHRHQARNQADALRHLRLRLACTVRGQSDRQWLAPWLVGSRIRLGANADGYPRAVAVALDALAEHGGSLVDAAAAVACSSSQLVKLLTADKEVHQAANAIRLNAGLGIIHAR